MFGSYCFVWLCNLLIFCFGTKKKELPLLEQVEITGVAAEGKALARVNDLVVFVPFAAPGDIVDLQLMRKKHNYAEARIVKFHAYSSLRVNPFCEHFGVCGGCKWQHVAYDYQLQFKRQQVEDNLTRIGKIPLPEILPTKGSTKQQYYRNKLEFSFSNKSWLTYEQLQTEQEFDCRNALGFHIPGMFDKVLDIKKCWLQDDISNRIRLSIRQCAIDNHYPFFDLREQTGFMRNIIIRISSTGEVMLIVVFFRARYGAYRTNDATYSGYVPPRLRLCFILSIKNETTRLPIRKFVCSGEEIIFGKVWKDYDSR